MRESVEILESIDARLRVLVVLMAAQTVGGLSQQQTVERLFKMGLDTRSIADATGIPSTTVSPIVSKLRKAEKS